MEFNTKIDEDMKKSYERNLEQLKTCKKKNRKNNMAKNEKILWCYALWRNVKNKREKLDKMQKNKDQR
jgi:hypothetical protein